MLTFDAARHEYRWNGAKVPGVTSILEPLSNFDFVHPEVLRAAQEFGTAVHLTCELADLGTLDEPALDPELQPYLMGWRQFCADHACEWELIEHPVYHQTMRYAGTLDRKGLVDGRKTVLDIKTSAALYPSVGPQTAAYARALPEGPSLDRAAVRLKGDGTYEFKHFRNPMDWPLFCSLITLRTWCKDNRITPYFKEHAHV